MYNQKYHFVGLGGIGMSALARILLQKGASVQGSDIHPSALLDELKKEGANVCIGHAKEALQGASIVVYSSDISKDNVELQKAKELELPIWHRSELLHALMQDKKPLLVTGTHGKTTVTALLSAVLDRAGFAPSFVLGGIHKQWNTNAQANLGEFFIAEADESDHSFIRTKAFGAIVTNLDYDHLNYWKEPSCLEDAFKQFFLQTLHPKHLFWCGDDPHLCSLTPKGISYGFQAHNALRIETFASTNQGVRFSLLFDGKRYSDIDLALLGRHNALNGAAVFGLALSLGAPESMIREAFLSFQGTKRRLEHKGRVRGVDLYDDYGHHPTEILATLKALRDKIRERRLIVVFQPHRYTRVQSLFEEFSNCFSDADLVIMTDIYSAGESPIPGVTSSLFFAKLQKTLKEKIRFCPRDSLEETVASFLRPYDVVLTLGAGDVTKTAAAIFESYEKKQYAWKVGVLFGGASSEHEVSLMSAKTILDGLNLEFLSPQLFGLTKEGRWITGADALERLEKKNSLPSTGELLSREVFQALTDCDIVIPILHGPAGEDGMVQGLLDTLQIAYAGSDYRASALCMHKGWTKHVARSLGVPTSNYIEFDRTFYRTSPGLLAEKIREELNYPIWVKPVHLGSSVGVYRVQSEKELDAAAEKIFTLDDTLIAEEEIVGREVEFSLLGNVYVRIAPPGEIIKMDAFHGYDNKYGPTASPIEVPAKITNVQRQVAEEMAFLLYRRTGCKGLARIDFFLDKEGHFWFNEINPIPGFTATSAYPAMWQGAGLSIRDLCDELLILALHKKREK